MAKSGTSSNILREVGVPLAALAMWLLCLLAPLHMAAGALRDLADAGVKVTTTWSICTTLADGENHPDNSVPICAVQCLAKMGMALPAVPEQITVALRPMEVIGGPAREVANHLLRTFGPNQPRAPPRTA